MLLHLYLSLCSQIFICYFTVSLSLKYALQCGVLIFCEHTPCYLTRLLHISFNLLTIKIGNNISKLQRFRTSKCELQNYKPFPVYFLKHSLHHIQTAATRKLGENYIQCQFLGQRTPFEKICFRFSCHVM
jgi:hypothetical protein